MEKTKEALKGEFAGSMIIQGKVMEGAGKIKILDGKLNPLDTWTLVATRLLEEVLLQYPTTVDKDMVDKKLETLEGQLNIYREKVTIITVSSATHFHLPGQAPNWTATQSGPAPATRKRNYEMRDKVPDVLTTF